MTAHEGPEPLTIPGMCDQGPPTYRASETPVKNRLTLQQAADQISDSETPHCVHYGTHREILLGREALCNAMLYTQDPEGRTHLEHIHQVPEETEQRNQDLWTRHVDNETGQILVEPGYDQSVWGISYFLMTRENGTVDPMNPRNTAEIADGVLAERSQERDFTNKEALATAMDLVRAVIATNTSELSEDPWVQSQEDPEWQAQETVMARATETLDIAYNYNRLVPAGVDLEQHPEYHTYQPFYDMGCKPPSHQEMADHIIGALAGG